MQHDAAVPSRPIRAARGLVTDEAVLDRYNVMGKLLFVEEVTETIVKFLVGVVGNPKQAVYDAEGVSKIVIKIDVSGVFCTR